MHAWLVLGSFALAVAWSPAGHVAPLLPKKPATEPASQRVIRSQAQLTRYLERTSPNAPPLGWLSPGGRKRFLAELQFGSHGLALIPLDDPAHELTHKQLVKLYTLFDLASVAKSMPSLTPAEQARRRHERRAAAKARGCDSVASCPESRIERRYDQLMLHRPDSSLPDAQRATWLAKHYDRLMADFQTADSLASVDRPDLRLLKRAAKRAISWNPDATYIGHLQNDLAEMQRRDMTDDKDFTALYKAWVASRQFDRAHALAQRHPGMDIAPLPAWQAPARLPSGQPTALALAAGDHKMTRQAFDLSAPLRIVIVASCHFSRDAARAIKAGPQLRPLFAKHAIWLADQRESIATARDWNRDFPKQPIHIAWRNSEWSTLNSWAMPTFYVFRHGKLVDQWAGWPADTGMTTLRHHLQKDGVL